MNEHVSQWLAAYHDGELNPQKAHMVETHLSTCDACRQELASLQSLRQLLQEHPDPVDLQPIDTFVAQVGLRLPRRQLPPAPPSVWQHAAIWAWRLAPVFLLGLWFFLRALLTQTNLLDFLLAAGLYEDPDMFLTQGLAAGWNLFLWYLGLSAVIGLGILSWVASVWMGRE